MLIADHPATTTGVELCRQVNAKAEAALSRAQVVIIVLSEKRASMPMSRIAATTAVLPPIKTPWRSINELMTAVGFYHEGEETRAKAELYEATMRAKDVDIESLVDCTERQLRDELGMSLGHSKRLRRVLAPYSAWPL